MENDRRWHPRLQPMEKNGGRMTVDPYAMMWSNGYYYLVCRDGNIMRNLRVDRIIQVLPTTLKFEKDTDFDPYAYRDRSTVMYPGEPTLIRMKCSMDRISTLLDFFGSAILDYSVSKNAPDETTVTLKASEKGVRLNTPSGMVPSGRSNGAHRTGKWCRLTAWMVHGHTASV